MLGRTLASPEEDCTGYSQMPKAVRRFDAGHSGSARRQVPAQEVVTKLCPSGAIVFLWRAQPGPGMTGMCLVASTWSNLAAVLVLVSS